MVQTKKKLEGLIQERVKKSVPDPIQKWMTYKLP